MDEQLYIERTRLFSPDPEEGNIRVGVKLTKEQLEELYLGSEIILEDSSSPVEVYLSIEDNNKR